MPKSASGCHWVQQARGRETASPKISYLMTNENKSEFDSFLNETKVTASQ